MLGAFRLIWFCSALGDYDIKIYIHVRYVWAFLTRPIKTDKSKKLLRFGSGQGWHGCVIQIGCLTKKMNFLPFHSYQSVIFGSCSNFLSYFVVRRDLFWRWWLMCLRIALNSSLTPIPSPKCLTRHKKGSWGALWDSQMLHFTSTSHIIKKKKPLRKLTTCEGEDKMSVN